MNHKRRRQPTVRGAMCLCHGMAKKLWPNKLGSPAHPGKGHSAREMRLRERAKESA